MLFGSFDGRFFAGTALLGFMLAVAGCQSGDGGVLHMGGDKQAVKPEAGKVTASSLRAYCPKVTLRAGTAYFNTYGNGGRKAVADTDDALSGDQQNDSANIIYQASIADVTRDCTHAGGTMTLNVAVAGKVVPGPLGKPGTITMPIRIVVTQGGDVLYSKLHQYKLQVSDMSAATQFVFNDPNIAVPEPTAANYQVFVGYDEGAIAPPKPPKQRVVRKKAPVAAAAPAPAPADGSQTSISDIPR
jgi:hypothetical protein